MSAKTNIDYEINLDNPLFFDFQEKFLQIKALAETGGSLSDIEKISRQSLNTLNFVLFANHASQTQLELTSISASGAVCDAASELQHIARVFNVQVFMDTSPKLDLVYSHSTAIKGIVFGLLSGVCSSLNSSKMSTVTVSVQQTNIGTQRIGLFSSDLDINLTHITKASSLSKNSKMSVPSLSSGSGAGFVIAKKYIDLLDTELQNFSHRGAKGVGFYVPLSSQLSFV